MIFHIQEHLQKQAPQIKPLVCRGPWMSTLVLYCWCHSYNASVLLYFTLDRINCKYCQCIMMTNCILNVFEFDPRACENLVSDKKFLKSS